MLPKESMLDISLWIIQLHAGVFLTIPMFVEVMLVVYHHWMTLFGLLKLKSHLIFCWAIFYIL
jgi:hypothetical protein